jgi:hypothetical protein
LAYQPQDIHIALYGQDYTAASNYYYFDQNGTATPTGTSGTVPTFTLSQLQFDATKSAYVINLPQELGGIDQGIQSARMYFALGPAGENSLTLTINGDGSVNAPKNDFNAYYDYIEFSLNAPTATPEPGNLNIDVTNVDQFSVPFQIVVDSTDPNNLTGGVGAATTRALVISQFQTFAGGTDFADWLWPVSGEFGPYRILSPGHVLDQSAVASTIIKEQTLLQENLTSTQTHILVNNSLAGFPDPNVEQFTVQIDSEVMTVTSGVDHHDGTTTWQVVRGANKTMHNQGAIASRTVVDAISATQTALAVGGNLNFPTTFPFTILVDDEVMLVTGVLGTNTGAPIWQVQRGYDGTTATTHNNGANVAYYSVIENPLNYYFNKAIDDLFYNYSQPGQQLTLVSNKNGKTYEGTVVQESISIDDQNYQPYVMRFTSADDTQNGEEVWYDVYYPFFDNNAYFWAGADHPQPRLTTTIAPPWLLDAHVQTMSPSEMTFLANGVFSDNLWRPVNPDLHFWNTSDQNAVLADLENQVSAALNRGVASLPGNEWLTPGNYYKDHGEVWNQYAQFLHQDTVSIGGLNYGFPYDDQAGQASDIGVDNFSSATITLGPWAGEPNPNPNPDPNPNPNPDPNPNPNPDPDPDPGSRLSMRPFMASRLAHGVPPDHSQFSGTTEAQGFSQAAASLASNLALDAALSTDSELDSAALDSIAFSQAQQNSDATDSGTPNAGLFSMRSLLSRSRP